MKDLHIIDATAYIFRAFHGLRPLTSKDGTPTNAVYGYSQMLFRILKNAKDNYVCATFDAKGPSFRKDLYPDYKANRPPAPEDLKIQIPLCIEFTKLIGVPVFSVEGVEADDVIATFAKKGKDEGMKITIHSADKDLMQLVDENTTLYDAMRKKEYDIAGVKSKFGIGPELVGDFLALQGDSADNIPGVAGVGPKTASKLLNQYGNLDNVLKATDIKGKLGDKIRDNVELARISRQLVELKNDVPFDGSIADLCTVADMQSEKLKELLNRLGFKKVLSQISALSTDSEYFSLSPSSLSKSDKIETGDKPSGDENIDKTEQKDIIDDLEGVVFPDFDHGMTISLYLSESKSSDIQYLGMTLFDNQNKYMYFPVSDGLFRKGADIGAVLQKLKPALENEKISKTIYQHKNFLKFIEKYKIQLRGDILDPLIFSYLIDPSRRNHSLDSLMDLDLDEEFESCISLQGTGKNALSFNNLSIEDSFRCSCNEVKALSKLAIVQFEKLSSIDKLSKIYKEIELPLTRVLAKMESVGVLLEKTVLKELEYEAGGEMVELEEKIRARAGYEININSPVQLRKFLFEDEGMPPIKKTKTGFSTDAETLEVLSHQYEVAGWIHRYRQLAKLMGTYITVLPNIINSTTGRVHTHFNQAVAATGRLSSSDPNLQNIPVRTPLGRRIREAFIVPDNHQMISLDYSQVELRVLAHLSKDSKLIDAFVNDKDIHSMTASDIFGVPIDEVTKEQRRLAKAVNFGVIYGQTPYGLSKTINISVMDAKEYIEKYFEKYPTIENYMDEIIQSAKDTGYAITMTGRRRPLIFSKRTMAMVQRMAQNTPIQGSAADIIKIAMIRCNAIIESEYPDVKMILTVHDELLFEVPDNLVDEFGAKVEKVMENAMDLLVPLKVDRKAADNWSLAH